MINVELVTLSIKCTVLERNDVIVVCKHYCIDDINVNLVIDCGVLDNHIYHVVYCRAYYLDQRNISTVYLANKKNICTRHTQP